MNIDRAIEVILLLRQYRSISKVAVNLYISEPALSKQIRNFEKEIGCTLIRRTSSGVSLTRAGEVLADRGKDFLHERDEILKEVRRASQKSEDPATVLKVGAAQCYSETLLPRFLPRFMLEHPDIKTEVINERTDELEKMCVEGVVDLVLTQKEFCDPRLRTVDLQMENTVLYMPVTYLENAAVREAYDQGSIPLILLKNYPHAEILGHDRFQTFVQPLYKEAGFHPNTVYWSENWGTVVPLLAQGLCYTVMPNVFKAPREHVVTVPIKSRYNTVRTLAFAWHGNNVAANVLDQLILSARQSLIKT